jgi:hypothetical protein
MKPTLAAFAFAFAFAFAICVAGCFFDPGVVGYMREAADASAPEPSDAGMPPNEPSCEQPLPDGGCAECSEDEDCPDGECDDGRCVPEEEDDEEEEEEEEGDNSGPGSGDP